MTSFQIRKPDDFHAHYREGKVLELTVKHAARQFARGIAMPNLKSPIKTVDQAEVYAKEIQNIVPDFTPLVPLYLTLDITKEELWRVQKSKTVLGIKFYPEGVTTNSNSGIKKLIQIFPILAGMEELGIPLLVHGETPNPDIKLADREAYWLDHELKQIMDGFPNLKIICEHITTEVMADFIKNAPSNIGATITPHHLIITKEDIVKSPHNFCYPTAKTKADRQALIELAINAPSNVFAGTDSAPHLKTEKECAKPKGGVYNGYNSLELYAQVFHKADNLEQKDVQKKLERFTSENGANFYGLPLNSEVIVLEKSSHTIPEEFKIESNSIIPFMAGEILEWRIKES